MTRPAVLDHLEREFFKLPISQRYQRVVASLDPDNDEILRIDATRSISENREVTDRFSFECGSDDDAFCFVNADETEVLILPLMPEDQQP